VEFPFTIYCTAFICHEMSYYNYHVIFLMQWVIRSISLILSATQSGNEKGKETHLYWKPSGPEGATLTQNLVRVCKLQSWILGVAEKGEGGGAVALFIVFGVILHLTAPWYFSKSIIKH